MVDVVDLLDLGMFQNRDIVEAGHLLAHHLEGGAERAERLHVGVGPHQFVTIKHDFADHVADWQDRLGKAVLVPGPGGAFLALDSISVDVITAIAIFGGDQIGGYALRDKIFLKDESRVSHAAQTVAAHRNARHGFDAAADRKIGFAGADLARRNVDRFQTRTAEAVDLDRRGGVGIAGLECCHAADYRALLADRRDAAECDVLDLVTLQAVAVIDRCQHLGGQVEGGDFVQAAVVAALAARRSDGVID